MPFFVPLALAAASAAASYAGNRAKKKGVDRAADRLKGVKVPQAEALQPKYKRPTSAGTYSPALEQEVTLGQTELGNVPGTGREAQLRALADLGRMAGDGGLAAEDRAALSGALSDIATQERGQREALGASARRQGAGGSALDLVRQQIAQQGAAERASRTGLEIAALASQRRQQALQQLGAQGGQLRDADSERARAQDEINRFNASNLASTRAANTAAVNDAALRNLGEAQRLRDADTDLANREEQARVNIPLQRYGLLTGRAQQLGEYDQASAGANQQMFGALAQLLSRGSGYFGGGQ